MKEEQEKLSKLLKNKTVIVSCSGGPDSMALLSVVNNIKDANNVKVIVAHVNHKVRKESDVENNTSLHKAFIAKKRYKDQGKYISELLGDRE